MTAIYFNTQDKLPASAGEIPREDKGSVTGGVSKWDEISAEAFAGILLAGALLGAVALMGLILG